MSLCHMSFNFLILLKVQSEKKMPKFWKSDGKEQKYLENLFRDEMINASMKPSDVQQKYPIFNGFSSAVFRQHWSKTKRMFDVDCKFLFC